MLATCTHNMHAVVLGMCCAVVNQVCESNTTLLLKQDIQIEMD